MYTIRYLVNDVVKGVLSGRWSDRVDLTMNGATTPIMVNDASIKEHVSFKREVAGSKDLLPTESCRVWAKTVTSLRAGDDLDAEEAWKAVYASATPDKPPQFFTRENSDDGVSTWA